MVKDIIHLSLNDMNRYIVKDRFVHIKSLVPHLWYCCALMNWSFSRWISELSDFCFFFFFFLHREHPPTGGITCTISIMPSLTWYVAHSYVFNWHDKQDCVVNEVDAQFWRPWYRRPTNELDGITFSQRCIECEIFAQPCWRQVGCPILEAMVSTINEWS